jgi:2-amino-4-hydroxy-6-hydroxymethyldihydropteridine diphosphokinase
VTGQAHIALGSNLGDRETVIQQALEKIQANGLCHVIRCSTVIETEPVGPPQPNYLNCAALVQTQLQPLELMEHCLDIEHQMGRDRTTDVRNGPRIIDLDVLFFGQVVMDDPALTLPHPRLAQRLFVLGPLNEIDPEFVHPTLGLAIKELFQRL